MKKTYFNFCAYARRSFEHTSCSVADSNSVAGGCEHSYWNAPSNTLGKHQLQYHLQKHLIIGLANGYKDAYSTNSAEKEIFKKWSCIQMQSLTVFISVVTLSFVLLFFTPIRIEASTYYVDRNHPSASNTNPGTLNLPWLTIQHAAEVLAAGDTVLIRDGVYYESIYPANSGNETEGYIVYSTYPGEQAIIDGIDSLNSNGIVISNKSYIKLLGLKVRNWNIGNAIWCDAGSHHIEISDVEVFNALCGIGMVGGVHDFELNRVKIHHFDLYGFDASPWDGPCYNGVFNDCIAYTGRDSTQNVDGFALGHGGQHDFIFSRCIVYDVFDGFDISASNTTLNRCASYNTWNAGYKLWQDNIKLINCLSYHHDNACAYVAWSGTPKTVTFQNCTFVDGGTYTIWIESSQDTLNMYNCIVASGDNIGLCFEQMGVDNYHGDYNIFHNDNSDRAIVVGYTDEFSLDQISAGAWTTYSGEDSHSFVSTVPNSQLFLNLSAWDLHLRNESIAIDTGTAQGAPSEDYDGKPRPSGNGYDIGAYEYQYPTGVLDPDRKRVIPETFALNQNYPNPFNPSTTIQFDIPNASFVTLKMYNVLGQEIATLVNEKREAGKYEVEFDGAKLTSGVYFYRLETTNISDPSKSFTQVRKMILLR